MKQNAFDHFPMSSLTPPNCSVQPAQTMGQHWPFFTPAFRREVKRRTFLTPGLLQSHENLHPVFAKYVAVIPAGELLPSAAPALGFG